MVGGDGGPTQHEDGRFCTSVTLFEKGTVMRRIVVRSVLAVLLFALVWSVCGCSMSQLGETTAEGHRRHVRMIRMNHQELWEDLDTLLLLDKPSKLSERTIR